MAKKVDPAVEAFCKKFYQQLASWPLKPHDPLYVPLFERTDLVSSDPVLNLLHCIQWQERKSVQLFSGFRGTGKSTELRRLENELVKQGYLVALCDMEDFLNLSMPVEVSDFLIALAGAFGEALDADHMLGKDPSRHSYWQRFTSFVQSEVQFQGVGVEGIKLGLKQDPDFKERVQDYMKGRLSALVTHVREFMAASVLKLRKKYGQKTDVVILLDSVEHLRGTSRNAEEVHASLENLFAGHADKLAFPSIHMIYTVPPWLKVRSPGIEGLYDGGEVIPCIKVRDQDSGAPVQAGLEVLTEIVQQRGQWQTLLGDVQQMAKVVQASGGYLRDLFRILQAGLRLAAQRGTLPLAPDVVNLAISDVRNDYLPLARSDAVWLEKVSRSHRAELDTSASLTELARFFDTHLVLCYRNGEEWFDVHPLVLDRVRELAAKTTDAPAG